jgi:hypothetical protein
MLAAIRRASSRVSSLAAAIPDDKAGVRFLDGPWRREAARRCCCCHRASYRNSHSHASPAKVTTAMTAKRAPTTRKALLYS